MARPLRILFPDAVYHVMSRGNNRMKVYHDDVDRERFLNLLEQVVGDYGVECHAYCLMSTHYHLVLKTPDANLSHAMRQLNGVFAQWWNRRHRHVGHLWQDRFKAQVVQRDIYFLEACRYVVLNPVRAGMVSRPGDWPWSSYAGTAGTGPCPRFLTVRLVLGSRERSAATQRAYQAFIAASTAASPITDAIRSDVRIIGTEEFVQSFRSRMEDAHPIEVPRRERMLDRPTLVDLFQDQKHIKKFRNPRIRQAHLRYQYTLSEIARHLGLHYSTVSKIVSAPAAAIAS